MGITPSFIIKHVRPVDIDAYNTLASQEFIAYLTNDLHLSLNEVIALLAAWKRVAESDSTADVVDAARAVTEARWDQLYPTSASTVMFLSAQQLVDLSQVGERVGPTSNFGWKAKGGIKYAVTIRRGAGTHLQWDVAGFFGATDGQANVNHFEKLA